MPSQNLTVRFMDTVKKPEVRKNYFDSTQPGLVFVVTPQGRKYFTAYGRAKGKQFRKTIGHYPGLSLSDARHECSQIMRNAKKGINPTVQARAEAQEEKAGKFDGTFKSLVAEYLKWHASKLKSYSEQKRIIEKEMIPIWGDMMAVDIRKRDLMNMIETIISRGAPTAANRIASLARSVFNFGIDSELIFGANPAARLKNPGGKESSRERVLSDTEIVDLWHGLDNFEMGNGTRQAIRLILVTGQRPGEVSSAPWTEFDLPNKVWTISGARAKNGVAHRVPLSKLALEILFTLPRDGEWLFPSLRSGKPIARQTLSKALRRCKFPDYTSHDLRRTMATRLMEAGEGMKTVAAILNHVQASVTGIYARYDFAKEKREALEKWGRKLSAIIGEAPDNVVKFR